MPFAIAKNELPERRYAVGALRRNQLYSHQNFHCEARYFQTNCATAPFGVAHIRDGGFEHVKSLVHLLVCDDQRNQTHGSHSNTCPP